MTPALEVLVGVKPEPPADVAVGFTSADVAVGFTTAEAGVVVAAFVLSNWSKQADDVACGQQESIRDCSRPVQR